MVEESGTLESQLEATKVSDAHSPPAETPFPTGDLCGKILDVFTHFEH